MKQYQALLLFYFFINCTALTSLSTKMSVTPAIFKKGTQLYVSICKALKQEQINPAIIRVGFHSAEVVNEFVRDLSPIPAIIFDDKKVKAVSEHINKSNHIFVFSDYVDAIERLLQSFDTHTIWNVKAFTYFTVCLPVNDTLWVERIVKLVWKNNILNFILVYYYERLELITYNPFENKIINLTSVNAKQAKKYILTNKLHNMYGYQLRVGFLADPPRIVEKNGVFYGADYITLKGFIHRLNATMKLIISSEPKLSDRYWKHYGNIVSGNADFGFVGFLAVTDAPNDVSTSYPTRMDDLVVLVPSAEAIPQFYYIFMVFGKTVWLLILGSFFTTLFYNVIALGCLLNQYKNYLELLLDACNNLVFGTPNHGLASLKIVSLFWILTCAIFDTLFRSLLTSGLITPKFGHNIEKLDELKANNVTITTNKFSTRSLKGQYPRDLVKLAAHEEIFEKLINQSTDSAYGVLMSNAELVISNVFRDDGRPVYHMLKEHLIPSYLVYLFSLNSPYLDEANKYLTVLNSVLYFNSDFI